MRAWMILLLAPVLGAQEPVAELLARLDADQDGLLTRKEFPGSDEQFTAADRDKDGKLTLAELRASAQAKRAERAERGNALPPRPRVDLAAQRLSRLEQLVRFDSGRDGRVARAEWRGDPAAFATLDLDGDGELDAADRALAEKQLAEARASDGAAPELPDAKSALPSIAEVFARFDRDKDQILGKAELVGTKLEPFLRWADRDGDQALDEDELRRLLEAVAQRQQQRDRGRERPQAYEVPFSTWDQNKDGRLDTNEFAEQKHLFARIDHDRDGAITREEVARYERAVEGEGFVGRFDLNGDGAVTPAEFGGPADAFRRADANGDGVVGAADR